jgi:hypothetical protein
VDSELGGYRKHWPQIVARPAPAPSTDEDRTRRLDQLSPLLHDLLAWELVTRTETGAFVLRADVQQRLAEASSRQAHPSTAIYVGRPCAHCGATGVTRLVDGLRSCPSCAQVPRPPEEAPTELAVPTELPGTAEVQPTGRRPRSDSHAWWSRKVG